MKRLLLSLFITIFSILGIIAQNIGDFVYVSDGKYKITSNENLLSNGDFSNSFKDWTSESGRELSTDTFTIVNDGPDGSACIYTMLKDNGPGFASSLYRKIRVRAGQTYYISYSVKADEDVTTSINANSTTKNYQNIFFNTEGSLTPEIAIAKSQKYGTEWKTIQYVYTPEKPGYIVFWFFAPYIGTRFDDFKVMEAIEVADDRKVYNMISRLESYRDNPDFKEGHETMNEVISQLKELLEVGDKNSINEFLYVCENEVVPEFLNLNTVDVSSYLLKPHFDELTPCGALKTGTGTTYENAWTVEGIRWKVANANDAFPTNYISRDIPGGQHLKEGKLYQTIQILPAGKYMFSMKARAYYLENKNSTTPSEFDIRGIKLFINNDSIEMHPIDTASVTTYDVYTIVKENEPITVGFYMPDDVANHIDVDYTYLRALNTTKESIDAYVQKKLLIQAKEVLKHLVDSASIYTTSADYLYDKDSLQMAINVANGIYDTAILTNEVKDATDSLKASIRTFIKHNTLFIELNNAIKIAEEKLNDIKLKNGRDAMQQAIATAISFKQTLVANPADRVAQDQAILELTERLNKAFNAFIMANTGCDDDFSYPFTQWYIENPEEAYVPNLVATDITTSSGTIMNVDNFSFGTHNFDSRLAYINKSGVSVMIDAKGLRFEYSGKNIVTMAILNLKEGEEITIDFNSNKGIYVASGNCSTTNTDSSIQNFTAKDAGNIKKETHLIKVDNNDGVNGYTRKKFLMSEDGSLDLFFGASNTILNIGYIGINQNPTNGIREVITNNLSSHIGVYNLNGQKIGNINTINSLPKGVYIINNKKYILK